MAAPSIVLRYITGLSCVALLLGGTGCGRLKHRLAESARTLTDPLFRHYDADQPDTRFNQKRFTEHLQLPCPPDVRQLYCYTDELGLDTKYLFSFRCTPATFRRLVAQNQLRPDSVRTDPSGLLRPFAWWPEGAERGLTAYWRTDREQWFQYLWYDARQQRAYYLEFTL